MTLGLLQQAMTPSRNLVLVIHLQGLGGSHVQATDRQAVNTAGAIQ
jgi:hypothetical protein